MKYLTIAIALAGTVSATSAFAQSSAPAAANEAAQVAQAPVAAPAQQSATPYDQPVVGKTRAQVYQELIDAEQDGQMANLTWNVYAGG
jgi:hypothetical protein